MFDMCFITLVILNYMEFSITSISNVSNFSNVMPYLIIMRNCVYKYLYREQSIVQSILPIVHISRGTKVGIY